MADPVNNMDRPARPQAKAGDFVPKDRSEGRDRCKPLRSKFRCIPSLDTGRTRAAQGDINTFCLYFCKGCCDQGQACSYLHRLPTQLDEARCSKDMSTDIFGREKRAEHEGYRSGAGTFERYNTTLYVLYEGAGSLELPTLRRLLEENFSEWGPLASVYIVPKKTIAFVKYLWRVSAEFAKEAMHHQGLRGSSLGEVLTVRWANDDNTNPFAIVERKRSHETAFVAAGMEAWQALPEEQRQARLQQLQMASALHTQKVISMYPDTDAQYEPAGGEGQDAYYYYGQFQQPSASAYGQYPDTDAMYGAVSAAVQYGEAGGGSWSGAQQPESSSPAAAGEQARGNAGAADALGLLAGYGSSSSDGSSDDDDSSSAAANGEPETGTDS